MRNIAPETEAEAEEPDFKPLTAQDLTMQDSSQGQIEIIP